MLGGAVQFLWGRGAWELDNAASTKTVGEVPDYAHKCFETRAASMRKQQGPNSKPSTATFLRAAANEIALAQFLLCVCV